MVTAEEQELVSPAEAAKRFGKSEGTIWLWLRQGKIRRFKNELDGRSYVDAREIERKLRPEPQGE